MAAKAPGRARRKGSNGRDGLASCMATTRQKRKPHGQRRVAQCERFNCSCGKQSRSDVMRTPGWGVNWAGDLLVLEAIRRELSVTNGIIDISMTEIRLEGPSIHPPVGQSKSASVSEHVRMHLDA
jgi:hypothetical protein